MCKLWFQNGTIFFPTFEGLVTPRGYLEVGFQHLNSFNIKEKLVFYDFILLFILLDLNVETLMFPKWERCSLKD